MGLVNIQVTFHLKFIFSQCSFVHSTNTQHVLRLHAGGSTGLCADEWWACRAGAWRRAGRGGWVGGTCPLQRGQSYTCWQRRQILCLTPLLCGWSPDTLYLRSKSSSTTDGGGSSVCSLWPVSLFASPGLTVQATSTLSWAPMGAALRAALCLWRTEVSLFLPFLWITIAQGKCHTAWVPAALPC